MTYWSRQRKALLVMLGHVGATYLMAACYWDFDKGVAIYLVYVCLVASFGAALAQTLSKDVKK